MIFPITDERLERVQRALAESSPMPKQPETINIGPLLELGEDLLLQFNGKLLRVPPVSYRDGLQFDTLWLRVVDASDAKDLRAMSAAVAEFSAFMGRLVRPCGRLRMLAWRLRWRPNPFAAATEREVRALADFFVFRRTNQNVRLSMPTTSSARKQRT